MLIREWLAEDNQGVTELEQECFLFPWNYEMVKETQSQSSFLGFVAEDNGQLIGYVGAIFCFNQADIALVAVKPELRRQGIAQMLINRLIEGLLIKNVDELFLEVRVSNTPARALYKKMGFEEVGIRKKYYEDTEDAIVMLKEI